MDRGGRNWTGSKRAANVMGGHAMERVVAGRYEWHDVAMGPMTGRRKRYSRGGDEGSGATGMMVTARVADFGLSVTVPWAKPF
mgnify:CR=1 FL=1